MPPPSTRSSSSTPVGWRSTSDASISDSVATACVAIRPRAARLVAVARRTFGDRFDERVPGRAARAPAEPLRARCRRTRCRCRSTCPWPWRIVGERTSLRRATPRPCPARALTSARWLLPSRRRCFDANVGRVGLAHPRRGRDARHQVLQAAQRLGAVHVLAARGLGLDDDDAVGRDALVAQREQALLDASGSDEARMSKRRCTALETLLTFCPPAPCARIALNSTSDSSTAAGTAAAAAGRGPSRGSADAAPASVDDRARAPPARTSARSRRCRRSARPRRSAGPRRSPRRPTSVATLPTRGCRDRRQVDRDHVHRDAADQRGADAVDQHRRAGRRDARIAVGVAAGDDADPHRPRRAKAAAVADAVAGLEILQRDQLGAAGSSSAAAASRRSRAAGSRATSRTA